MANPTFLGAANLQNLGVMTMSPQTLDGSRIPIDVVPGRFPLVPPPIKPLPTPPQPAPSVSPTPAPPMPVPPQPVPPAPVESPFDKLPFPSPGDRIKSDDFKALSQSLKQLYDLVVLSSTLFGQAYGDVRLILGARGYQIGRIVTVFGNELTNLGDTSLDARKVLQVISAAPGHPTVMLVLSEGVDTRRFMPDLVNMSYTGAQAYVKSLLGDVTIQGAPPAAPQLVGLGLAEAANTAPR